MKNSSSCSRILCGAAILATLAAGHALAAPTANGRIVYGNNSTTPQNAAYTASTNTFVSAATLAGANPTFIVDRAAPTRNEHIAGYVTTTGVLYVYRWNGTSWINETSTGNGWGATVTVGGDGVNGRRFDIAYENVTGDAVVVYSNNTSGTNELRYRVWNGSTWTPATNLDSARLTAVPAWVKMVPRPGSDEIALMVADNGTNGTANSSDLTALVWSGTAWGNEPGAALATNFPCTTAQLLQNDAFDMAWETTSGILWVFWSQSTPQQYRRSLSAARPTGTWATATSFGTADAVPGQMVAASDPQSNNVLVAWNSTTAIYASVNAGGTWSSATTAIDGTTTPVTPAINKKTIAGQWLVSGGTSYPVVLWGTSTAGSLGRVRATVSGTTVTWGTAAADTLSGATSWGWMDSAVDPQGADTLMLTYSDGASDLWAKRLVFDGATPTLTWTDANGGAALTATLTNTTTQNFDFAYDRYVPPPTLTLGNNSGTEAASATICAAPGVATYVDHFTLLASGATSVTGITTTFNTSPGGLLSLLEVTDDAGAVQGSLANPSGLNPAVTISPGFAAPTGTAAQYRLRITPSAATTSAPSFTATVTGVTTSPAGSPVTGTDASGATIVVDGVASPDVTGATAVTGSGTVTAGWTNPAAGLVPGTDFGGYVVVLGNTVPITGAPAKGTSTYAVPGAIGADSIVCAGNIQTCAATNLAPNQAYYLKIFTRDGCANWSAGVQVTATTPSTTTLADGTNPGAASLPPGGAETPLDAFTLQASSGTDTVTAATVTLAAGTSAGLSLVRIMSGATCTGTQYGSGVPSGDVVSFTGLSIPVTIAATPSYVCVTPKSHAAMPAPPGAVYAVTGRVTAFTSTNAPAGTDAGSATVTIDNASSPDVTGVGTTSTGTSVTASWTNPGLGVAPATDFGSYVVVLGNTAPVTNVPVEGTATYTANGTNTIGSDLIVCSGNVATCQKAGLTAGQTYYMKIFTRDTVNNWSAGVAVSATTLDTRTTPVALSGTAASCSLVNLAASYTGDTPTSNNAVTFARGATAAGPFTNLAACTSVTGGANPRACADSTVAASTTYYYRATFADSDGIVGSASVDSGGVTVPACPPALAVTAGTMPAGVTLAAGSSGTIVGRVVLTASNAAATLDTLSISNTGTALAGADVSTLSLFNDTGGAFVGAGAWNAATSHWDFGGLGLGVAVGTPVTLRVVLGLNIGATGLRTFAMNVNVPADVAMVAPSVVSNSATIAGSTFTVGSGAVAGSTNAAAPMVSILNPAGGKVVSPNNQYKVQIRVFNPGGIAALTANSVALSTDNGTTWPACPGSPFCATRNANYDSGTTGTVYEVIVTGQAAGAYTLRARASNATVANVVSEPVAIVVGAPGKGDGNLLVRDNSSQLCSDCHALATHSSEAMFGATGATKYGAWAVACRDCHAPHGTRNVFLVNETITPPSAAGAVQPAKKVGFVTMTGDSNAAGWDTPNGRPAPTASFVNSDNTGPCQVCHTRTQSTGAVARWRNTGNADSHYTATVGTQPCSGCHSHTAGFAAGESKGATACHLCHNYGMRVADATRTNAYHHVMEESLVLDASQRTSYPTNAAPVTDATPDKTCVQCHADHNLFRPDMNPSLGVNARGNNLRTRIGGAPPAAASNVGVNAAPNDTTSYFGSSDYLSTGVGGVCISCHAGSQTKDWTNQKNASDGTVATATVPLADFSASAHGYNVTGAIASGGSFTVACTKCHNSESASYQSGTFRFGLHNSVDRRLRAPLGQGAAQQDDRSEAFCFRCHSTLANAAAIGGTAKPALNNDWYGAVTTMSAASQDIYDQMQKGSPAVPAGGATTATNTLYFKPNAQEPAGVTLTGHYGNDTFASGTFATRSMSPYAPTGANELWDATSITTGTTNPTRYRRVAFVSPPVATQVTLSAAAWTLAPFVQTSTTTPSPHTRYAIWKYDGTCTYVGATPTCTAIVARTSYGTGTTNRWTTTLAQQLITTAAGSATTLNVGDRLVVDLEVETQSTTATAALMNYGFGATAAAYVTIPNSVTFTYTNQGSPASGRHDVGSYTALHRPNPAEETRGHIATNKHVECEDCHDPHAAKAGVHTQGVAGLAGVLTGASGVGVTTWGTNWTGVTAYNPSATTAPLVTATAEWQVCFKCHSGANANVASWGGSGATAFTDLALELNPNNESYHPVIQALPATGNRQLAATALTGGWTPGMVMTCSDCHGSDTTASHGPHGSGVKWMLNPNTTGTKYYNWPYTTAAANGTSSGTFLTGTGSTTVPTANFCFSCHVWAGGGDAHIAQGTSHVAECVGCHIRVPHGGKVLRLLTGANAPARYKPDGNGGGTVDMDGGTRPATGTMGQNNCNNTTTGCNQHQTTGSMIW